jgi:anti-sigma-K factor RskA
MTAHEQYRDDLPLYAVGALTREESQQIERHLAECAGCREELRGFQEAASHIAMAVPPSAPPALLKTRLLARLEGEQLEPAAAAPAPPKKAPEKLNISSVPLPERRGLGTWFWLPAFATACLAILSIGLWVQDRALLQELRQQERITADLQFKQQAFENARAIIDTMTAVDAQHVTLAAAGAKRQPGAKAVYSPQQHSLVLLAGNLNPLPANKVYELWLLPAGGAQPVPAGTFQPDANGSATLLLSQFADGAAAKGFAVTIENEPGASAPTMPIILSGTT